jgi:hypothetical protein
VRPVDLNDPPKEPITAEVVYCYGVLYHLERIREAIGWMSRCARRPLLIETCVSAKEGAELYSFDEVSGSPTTLSMDEAAVRHAAGFVAN